MPGFLVAFKAVLLGCLLWLVLGLPRYQLVAIVTCLLLTLFDGMAKGMGHINHSKLALLYSAYILAAFPCADALALARRRRPLAPPVMYAAPMVGVAMIILVAYCAIGVHRIGKTGFELFASNTLGSWFLKRALEANPTGFALGLPLLESPLVFNLNKLSFAVTGMFEALSPLCLFSRYFRWAWICAMIPFHVATLLTMNIFFWPNIVIIAIFMTDSDRVISRWLGARGEAPPPLDEGQRAPARGDLGA